MGVKFSNNAEGTLAGNLTAIATTTTLNAGQGAYFPVVTAGSDNFFYCTLTNVGGDREVIKVTQHTAGDVFQTIERAVDSIQEEAVPTAYAFSTNDTCQLRLNKLTLVSFNAGTSNEGFLIDTENDGPYIKNNSDTLEIKLYDDSDYTDLHAEGLTLEAALAIGGAITGATTIDASGVITGASLVVAGTVTGVTDLTASGTVQAEHLYSTDDCVIDDDLAVGGDLAVTGTIAGAIANEATDDAIQTRDHGAATTGEAVNVVYGTGSPPTASNTTIGCLFIKYTA